MTIRTLSDLEASLDDGLAWRKIEIAALRSSMRDAARGNPDAPLPRALRRSCVAIGYAHWEGYVKQAFTDYGEYLKRQRLRLGDLNDALLVSCVQLMSRKLIGNPEAHPDVAASIRNLATARAQLPIAEFSDTKSNLRFRVLSSILNSLGLDKSAFETRRNWIDVILCDQRNDIAHGRVHFPGADDAAEIAAEVITLMENVRDLIMAAARSAAHLSGSRPEG